MSTADTAATYNITVYKGEPFKRTITVRPNGALFDWTGYTGLCQVRKQAGSATIITTANITFDATRTNGVFHFDLPADRVALLPLNSTLYFDVRMTKTGADPYYPIKGSIAVKTRVSLPT